MSRAPSLLLRQLGVSRLSEEKIVCGAANHRANACGHHGEHKRPSRFLCTALVRIYGDCDEDIDVGDYDDENAKSTKGAGDDNAAHDAEETESDEGECDAGGGEEDNGVSYDGDNEGDAGDGEYNGESGEYCHEIKDVFSQQPHEYAEECL